MEIIVILSVIAFVIIVLIDHFIKVKFEDDKMAELIAKTVGVESPEELRVNDVEKVTLLDIAYTSYYDTLVDIEKCSNLKSLFINCSEYVQVYYPFPVSEMPEPERESKAGVKRIERELGSILKKCSKVKNIYISNEKGNCKLDSIGFLKEGKNLGVIYLCAQKDIDYSPISECKELVSLSLRQCDVSDLSMLSELENLELLYLEGTNVAEVEELLKLKNLNNLEIKLTDTPLAEKKEELEKLQQQFPGLVIRMD